MKLPSLTAIACIVPFFWGALAMGHGSLDEAVGECLEKLEINPADQTVRYRLATAYVLHGDGELALRELDKLNSSAIDSRLTRARAWMLCSRYEEAQMMLNSILETAPDNAQALLERARVFAGLGKTAESLADYRMTLNLTPQPDFGFYLEMTDALIAQNLIDEAITVVQKGLTAVGEVPMLLLRAMELEIGAGKYEAALSRIKSLENQAPRPEPWMARRAELLAQAGRPEEARAAWTALKKHLFSLPNLQRGTPEFLALVAKADAALTLP